MNAKSKITTIRKANSTLYGSSLVIISSIFYGSYGVWSRLMRSDFEPYTQLVFRCLIVLMILVPLSIRHKQIKKVHWRRDAKWLLLSLFTSVFSAPGFYFAATHIGVGLSTAINYAALMLTLLFAGWLVNHEVFTLRTWVSVILALAGLYLAFAPSFSTFGVAGFVAALVAGAAAGLNIVATQKMPYSASQSMIFTWFGGLIVGVPFSLYLHEKVPSLHHLSWAYLIIFGITSLIASWSVIRAAKIVAAGLVGVLGLLEIVVGIIFGVLFFGERPSLVVLLGALLICLAALLPYIKELTKKQPESLKQVVSEVVG